MADKQIAGLTSGTLDVTKVFPFQIVNGSTGAEKATIQDIIDLVPTSSGVQLVTGFGVDNTDPLNPVVNKFTSGFITAAGTDAASATLIVKNYSVINAGTGGLKLPPSPSIGDFYSVGKGLGSDFIVYGNGANVTANNITSISFTLTQTGYFYHFIYTSFGWFVNQEQVASAVNGIVTTKISLTSAEILGLATTPKTLIAAQGASTLIQPLSFTFKLNYNSIPYATNTNLSVFQGAGQQRTDASISGWLNKSVLSLYTYPLDQSNAFFDGSDVAAITNTPLKLTTETGNPTAGNSTIDVYVTYTVITL